MAAEEKIISLLEDFIEEEDNAALEEALRLVKKSAIDITSLLNHIENFKGDIPRKRRAITAVRKQLGLPIIPGSICRSGP